MNELVVQDQPEYPAVPVAAIHGRIVAIKSLIDKVMQEKVHYGTIPGTKKMSLWQPGADLILSMFRIGIKFETEDLSRGDVIHYRSKCIAFSQVTGQILGEGQGEASTGEEKYRWRKAICDPEFEEVPETERRIKYGKGDQGGIYTIKQIKTNAADSANTILKMANKRAKLAVTLTVAGCSDFFSQDLEDIEGLPGEDEPQQQQQAPQPAQRASAAKKAAPAPSANFNATGPRAWLTHKFQERGLDQVSINTLLAKAGIKSLDELTAEAFDVLKAELVG